MLWVMSHTAELLRQVWANPSDDHVRRVLADALISEGDPRGELILVQAPCTPSSSIVTISRSWCTR